MKVLLNNFQINDHTLGGFIHRLELRARTVGEKELSVLQIASGRNLQIEISHY